MLRNLCLVAMFNVYVLIVHDIKKKHELAKDIEFLSKVTDYS